MTVKNVAKTLVLNDRNEILLLRRSPKDPRRPGDWDYPGGGVDDSEGLLDAAIRELHEEAGLKIGKATLKLVYAATELYEDNNESVSRLLFVAKLPVDQSVQLSDEHDKYQWVDIKTALALFPHPFYGEGLRYAEEHNLLDL